MKDILVKGIDRKGETISMHLESADALTEANIKAVCAYSYAGYTGYTQLIETDFASAQAVTVNTLIENDKDFKAIMTFKEGSAYFKVALPCPKINVEGGIVVRWGSERAEIPAASAVGETGDDGNDVAAKLSTLRGTTVTFKSGHLYKRP